MSENSPGKGTVVMAERLCASGNEQACEMLRRMCETGQEDACRSVSVEE